MSQESEEFDFEFNQEVKERNKKNENKNQEENVRNEWLYGFIHLSTFITIVILIFLYVEDFINGLNNPFIQVLFILITGLGGLGIYLSIALKINKVFETIK
jgi:polyferredoxin